MSIAIIKYNAGNVRSVECAMRRMGVEAVVTADKTEIMRADKVIFPGVGQAATTMEYLRRTGLDQTISSLTQPLLGICLGMQLMCGSSEEGDVDCLGIFDERVSRFVPLSHGDKVPHMGWNTLSDTAGGLFKGFTGGEFVYFVHSYYVPVGRHTIAQTGYIHPFSAAMNKDNFYATQFHPEKSGSVGELILRNFLEL